MPPDVNRSLGPASYGGKKRKAFTLTEMLVSVTLLIIVVGLVLKLTSHISNAWRNSNSRIQSFQEARAGFEAMTRNLAQATLNTYYDYYNSSQRPRTQLTGTALASFVPYTYDRLSDLHFISGQAATLLENSEDPITGNPIVTQTHAVFFQAPLGYSVSYSKLENALNACGYFLQFDDAAASVPDYIKNSPGYTPRYRWRLMEMMQTTEELAIYSNSASPPGPNDWFVKNAAGNSRILAENVIALILLPKLPNRDDDPDDATGKGVSLAPNFNYNSRISLGATSDADWPSASPPFPPDQFKAYPKNGVTDASRHHQLPPILRVVMVVIDEPSAKRLHGNSTGLPPAMDLASTQLFQNADLLDADLLEIENICNAKPGNATGNSQKLVYRIFRSDLIMREAKWSSN